MNQSTIFLIFCFLLFSCKSEPIEPDHGTAKTLPLLSSGTTIGTIVGFNASNPPATTDSIQARWQEALDAGMHIGRIQIDWAELEPSPNVYDKEALEDQLVENQQQGLASMLTLSTIDSDALTIPEDLTDQKINSSATMDRLKLLMDWIVPMMVEHGGWAITIANEPDNHFEEQPKLWRQVRDMVREIRDHVHRIDARMAITVTLTEGGFSHGGNGYEQILAECDMACFNFYGQSLEGKVHDQAEIIRRIENMLAASKGKQLVIQELGISAGYEQNSLMEDASPEQQRLFFETVFEKMGRHPQFQVAYIFQLVDWSPETADIYREAFAEEGFVGDFVDLYIESLRTLGLIEYGSGQRRPAWNEFVRWLEHFR